jgi:hypothetical protein
LHKPDFVELRTVLIRDGTAGRADIQPIRQRWRSDRNCMTKTVAFSPGKLGDNKFR